MPYRAPTFKGPRVRAPTAMHQTTAQQGYDYAWQKLRAAYLALHPLCECEECDAGRKRVRIANVVHHKREIATHPHLRLVWTNLQAMAKRCHDKHTGTHRRR
jgi:5-methylcytosine-specific restriction protein A